MGKKKRKLNKYEFSAVDEFPPTLKDKRSASEIRLDEKRRKRNGKIYEALFIIVYIIPVFIIALTILANIFGMVFNGQ